MTGFSQTILRYLLRAGIVALLGGILLAQNEPGKPANPDTSQSPETIYKADTKGLIPPRIVYAPDPEYSAIALRAGTYGTVDLRVVITSVGKPSMIHVKKSLGNGLDEKAVKAVRTCLFKPAVGLYGKLVYVWTDFEVNFRIK